MDYSETPKNYYQFKLGVMMLPIDILRSWYYFKIVDKIIKCRANLISEIVSM